PFAGEEVQRAFEAEGIRVLTEVRVTAARRNGSVTVRLTDDRELEGDELFVSVGRHPATSDLGLEAVGLEPGRPVEVDDSLRAAGVDDGWLYAVGDVNGRAPLTHMGKYQARLAADAILGREVNAFADAVAVPRVT